MNTLKSLLIGFTLTFFVGCTNTSIENLHEALPAIVSIDVERRASPVKPVYTSLHKPSVINNYTSPVPLRGNGGGVILDKEGHIITNNHVIKGYKKIFVRLNTGQVIQAKVIGGDPDVDIAVLKVPTDFIKHITPIKIGDSSKLQLGQSVYAVGDPSGFRHTITKGIISSLNIRKGFTRFEDYIQTDASINPGNSGGPLITDKGELIGISTIMVSSSGGSVGLNFAISSNLAINSVHRIKQFGHVPRVILGIKVTDFKVSPTQGILVLDSKDEQILTGDYITHFQGTIVKSSAELKLKVSYLESKDPVQITVVRNEEVLIFTITPF